MAIVDDDCHDGRRGGAEICRGVTQMGLSNYAVVDQVADLTTSIEVDQEASQSAEIHQSDPNTSKPITGIEIKGAPP